MNYRILFLLITLASLILAPNLQAEWQLRLKGEFYTTSIKYRPGNQATQEDRYETLARLVASTEPTDADKSITSIDLSGLLSTDDVLQQEIAEQFAAESGDPFERARKTKALFTPKLYTAARSAIARTPTVKKLSGILEAGGYRVSEIYLEKAHFSSGGAKFAAIFQLLTTPREEVAIP